MRLITLLMLVAVTVTAQTPDENIITQGGTGKVWRHKKVIVVEPGGEYNFTVNADTVLHLVFDPSEPMTIHMTASGGTPAPPAPTTRDDHASSMTYFSTWTKANNLGWTQVFYDKTVSYSAVNGAKAETTFTGTRYEIWAEKRNNHGACEVWQKKGAGTNTKMAEVNLYDPTITSGNNSTKVYDSGVMPADTYVVSWVLDETVAGRDITLDKIVIYP